MSEKHILVAIFLLLIVSLSFWTTKPAPLLVPTLLICQSSTELLSIITPEPSLPLEAFLVGWPKPPCFVFAPGNHCLVSISKACVVFACTNFEVASTVPMKSA